MTKFSSAAPEVLSVIGIDIGKDVFHLVGFDACGTVVLRRKIKRLALVSLFEKLPRCVVGMEACLSAHIVSRTLRRLGFEPRIIPAKYTKPFVKGQKKRLQRCRGDRRGGIASEPQVRPREDTRPARPAGASSCALTAGFSAHSDNQSDPCLPD